MEEKLLLELLIEKCDNNCLSHILKIDCLITHISKDFVILLTHNKLVETILLKMNNRIILEKIISTLYWKNKVIIVKYKRSKTF